MRIGTKVETATAVRRSLASVGAVAALLILAGCGRTILADDAETEGDDDEAAERGEDGREDRGDERGDDGPGDEGPGDDGPGDDDDDDNGPDDDGVGDFDIPDSPDFPTCWRIQPIAGVPANVSTQLVDQNFDGISDVYFFDNGSFGPGGNPGTGVTVFDGNGEIIAEIESESPAFGVVDVNGDGLGDLITISFGGPGNVNLGYRLAVEEHFYEPEILPMDFDVQQNRLSGFFDATGDGLMDIFSSPDQSVIELRQGDGFGGFFLSSALLLGVSEFMFVSPIAGEPSQIAVGIGFDAMGGPGGGPPVACPFVDYTLLTTPELLWLASVAEFGAGEGPTGTLRHARQLSLGETALYVDDCSQDEESLHGLRALVSKPGGDVLEDIPLLDGAQWATVGDFDADGTPDMIWGDAQGATTRWARGIDGISFDDDEDTFLESVDVEPNQLQVADMDGDGRDDLLRAIVLNDDDPPQLGYERVTTTVCPD